MPDQQPQVRRLLPSILIPPLLIKPQVFSYRNAYMFKHMLIPSRPCSKTKPRNKPKTPSHPAHPDHPKVCTLHAYYSCSYNKLMPSQHGEWLKSAPKKLGNAAIFGAGATAGADAVKSVIGQ